MSKSHPRIQKLVADAVRAIKAGDVAAGRGMLEAVVKMEPDNEEAWLWLAQIVEGEEEKRKHLGNVILINPANKEARALLAELDAAAANDPITIPKKKGAKAGTKLSPRLLLIIGAGLSGLLILILALIALSGGGDDFVLPTVAAPQIANATNQAIAAMTETAQASITPTATISPTRTTGAPTWTPSPQATNTPAPMQFPPPPAELTGRLLLQAGSAAVDPINQPIVMIPANDPSQIVPVSFSGQRGISPVLSAGRDVFAWMQYFSNSRIYGIQIQNFGAENSVNITEYIDADLNLEDMRYPQWFGNRMVFSAQERGALQADLWLVIVPGVPVTDTDAGILPPSATPTITAIPPFATSTPEGATPPPTATLAPSTTTSIFRLTTDPTDETWSAFDPDGANLVFVAGNAESTDLKTLNLVTAEIQQLTSNGNQLMESAPDWGTDNQIVFSGIVAGSGESDIYIMPADGSAEPRILIDLGAQDIQPRFSPDGQYVAFSSNINTTFDVFIYELATETIYQVTTDTTQNNILNDWNE